MARRRREVLILAAVIVPVVTAVALIPLRGTVAGAGNALVLVLVVVAVAAGGSRVAGVLSALFAGAAFDFFLTRPYQRLTIDNAVDAETTVVLLLVGVAVSEIAGWGRRQHALAERRAGYLDGIAVAAESVGSSISSPTLLIEQICDQLTRMLGLHRCEFDHANGVIGGDRPRLRSDGQVEWRGAIWDVDRDGLPTQRDIEFLVIGADGYRGRFLLSAAADSRPSLGQRLVAAALAQQVAGALADRQPR